MASSYWIYGCLSPAFSLHHFALCYHSHFLTHSHGRRQHPAATITVVTAGMALSKMTRGVTGARLELQLGPTAPAHINCNHEIVWCLGCGVAFLMTSRGRLPNYKYTHLYICVQLYTCVCMGVVLQIWHFRNTFSSNGGHFWAKASV